VLNNLFQKNDALTAAVRSWSGHVKKAISAKKSDSFITSVYLLFLEVI